MASKEFENFLSILPHDKKNEIAGLGKEAAKEIDLGTIQKTNSARITQHSTPNDTYRDAHRTAAPTTTTQQPETPSTMTPLATTNGNSATFNEISSKPTTACTPTDTETNKLTQ